MYEDECEYERKHSRGYMGYLGIKYENVEWNDGAKRAYVVSENVCRRRG